MNADLEFLYGLGLKRRQVAETLGVSSESVSAWRAGRSSPSACVHGAVEAIRVLEAGLGREKTLALIVGHPPQRWMVAVAALAGAVVGKEA